MEISISKKVLPLLDEFVFDETFLGESRRSITQCSNSTEVHVQEYEDRSIVNKNDVDIRVDPIRHLVRNSVEMLLALGVTLASINSRPIERSKDFFGRLIFFVSLLSLRLFGLLKRLL